MKKRYVENKTAYLQNFPNGEYISETIHNIYYDDFTEEELETIIDYIPYGEHGIHTIVEIFVVKIEEVLFDEKNIDKEGNYIEKHEGGF
jgi:hypothetical protein